MNITENGKDLTEKLAKKLKEKSGENPVYFCVGSDLSLMDSLGPRIGSRLKEKSGEKLNVYGVQGATINALNVKKAYRAVKYLHPQSKIIVIDAATGDNTNEIRFKNCGIRPGAGSGKDLGVVGDIGILCTFGDEFDVRIPNDESFIYNNIFVDEDEKEMFGRLKSRVNAAVEIISDAILLSAA